MKTKALQTIIFSVAALSLTACDLTEQIQSKPGKEIIFGSEAGLELYANSFYIDLPTLETGFRLDEMCDIAAVNVTDKFIVLNGYNVNSAKSWSWSSLTNINYFIDGCNDARYCTVSDAVRDNYIGIARWFRAWFYYDKLKTYGGVPWFGTSIRVGDYDVMYKERDSRDVIISAIIDDLDFAYGHITATSSIDSSTITKWAAAALKSRVCLFEASYRRYHNLAGLTITAEDLYAQAADAASKVMSESKLSLNMAAGQKGAYRDLFYLETPVASEVILAVCANGNAGIYGKQNWWYNSKSLGNCWSLTRPFINTYLTADGTPYTDIAGYQTQTFAQEMASRDGRLAQTVRGTTFTMDGKAAVPDFKGVSLTGYQMIKYTLDESKYNDKSANINSIPLIRYAEVLLNYAEAKAELGTLTAAEWQQTVGALRTRAGITGGTATLPTKVDSYLQSVFYPDVTNPVVLEVRRERAIELVGEGMRFDDLRRWKRGELLAELAWDGMHIEALDAAVDMNGDGAADFYFTATPDNVPAEYADIAIAVNVGGFGLSARAAASGYDLYYKIAPTDRNWYSDGRQYLYPIPAKVIANYQTAGYHLSQNDGWK